MASSLPEPPERHFGYECRRCRVSDFGGRRYSCWICPNFDVCGECYDAGQIPLTRHHLYYHPLEAHFDRREFRVYFEGEAYGSDMQALQSYKCALCDTRGMSGADLYRHLLQTHRDHQDYSSYIAMVYSHYLKHNSLGPCNAAETPSQSTTSQMLRRVRPGSYRPPNGSGVRKSTIRTPTVGSVDIVNLLGSIPEMLDPHNDDLPYKCMEVVNTIGTLRAQQNACTRAEEAAAIGSYVRVLEQEILSRMSEWRQLREGRSSSSGQLMRRRSGLIPGSSASSAVSMAAAVRGRPSSATPSPLSTSEHTLNARRYMDVWPAATRPFRLPPSAVAANKEFREALAQSAKSKSGETPKEAVVAKKIVSPVKKVVDPRFLCPKLLANDKKAGTSDSKTKQLKANFIQAILCSMLADNELVSMPFGLPHPINDPYFVEASAGFGGNRLENAWVAWNEPVFYYDCIDQNLMPAVASDGVENPILPVIVEDAVEHDDE